MRRFFLREKIEVGRLAYITDQDAHHINHVLRLAPGAFVEIADTFGHVGIAKIERFETDRIVAYVESLKTGGAEPPVSLILAQGLPKGDKMEYIVQKAVELGVSIIQPMICEHSIVRYDEKKAAGRVLRWQTIAQEAAKQAKRDIVPRVAPIRDFKHIVANCPDDTVAIMLYEGKAPLCLRDVLRHYPAEAYLLLIGPEGGFSQAEVELGMSFNMNCVTLGPRILRTETASLAAVSIIQYEYGDLGGLPCCE